MIMSIGLLRELMSFDACMKSIDIETRFEQIAEMLFESFAIQKGKTMYLFKEIEFYFYNKNHRDIVTHPRESKPLCWYVNDFGGIDLNFESKIKCHSRHLYEYDEDRAKRDLLEYLAEYEWEEELKYSNDTLEEVRDYEIDCILEDLNHYTGLGSKAYDRLSEIDGDCFEWISEIGKEDSGVLDIYLTAFELAQKQLENN